MLNWRLLNARSRGDQGHEVSNMINMGYGEHCGEFITLYFHQHVDSSNIFNYLKIESAIMATELAISQPAVGTTVGCKMNQDRRMLGYNMI